MKIFVKLISYFVKSSDVLKKKSRIREKRTKKTEFMNFVSVKSKFSVGPNPCNCRAYKCIR